MNVKEKLDSESYVKYNSGFTMEEKEKRDSIGEEKTLVRITKYQLRQMSEDDAPIIEDEPSGNEFNPAFPGPSINIEDDTPSGNDPNSPFPGYNGNVEGQGFTVIEVFEDEYTKKERFIKKMEDRIIYRKKDNSELGRIIAAGLERRLSVLRKELAALNSSSGATTGQTGSANTTPDNGTEEQRLKKIAQYTHLKNNIERNIEAILNKDDPASLVQAASMRKRIKEIQAKIDELQKPVASAPAKMQNVSNVADKIDLRKVVKGFSAGIQANKKSEAAKRVETSAKVVGSGLRPVKLPLPKIDMKANTRRDKVSFQRYIAELDRKFGVTEDSTK